MALLLWTLLDCNTSAAQTGEEFVIEKLSQYLERRPQEKVFVHLNKRVFVSGETLWFKAYLVNATSHRPSFLSKTLYLDLINEEQQVLEHRILKVNEGTGFGEIDLVDSLAEGNYAIRAYTNYMLNFDNELIFSQPIEVLNYSVKKNSLKNNTTSIDVQFFPEGGELVNDLVNTVAFKAIDDRGLGITVSGVVYDNLGDSVTQFKSEFGGMGRFRIIPIPSKRYTVKVNFEGNYIEYPLVPAKSNGPILQLTSSRDKMTLRVLAKNYSLKGHFLFAYQKGAVILILQPDPTNTFIYSTFLTSSLPTGPIYFTLFDSHHRAVLERMAFINNSHQFPKLNLKNPPKAANREQIIVNLQVDSLLVNSELSVSVCRENKNNLYADNILTHLSLTSDLAGNIESPMYYFTEGSEEKLRHLDNLMLTQGWRRFKWNQVLADTLPDVKYPLEQSLRVTGRLFKYYNRNKLFPGEVSLTVLENPLINATLVTKEDARFVFDGLEFPDTTTIVIQAKKPGKKIPKNPEKQNNDAYFIAIDEPVTPTKSNLIFEQSPNQISLNDAEKRLKNAAIIRDIESQFGEKVILLEAMEIRRQKDPLNDPIGNQAQIYNKPTARFILDSMDSDPRRGAASVVDILNAIQIPGFNPRTFQSRGATSITGSNTVAVFYDGMQVDLDFVRFDLSPNDVGTIDYFTGSQAAIFGAIGATGVLSIYPRVKDSFQRMEVPGIINFTFPGYYAAREFYTPNYQIQSGSKPDFRHTLYWNPSLQTGSDGEVSFSFYTSDEDTNYSIDVQGLTKNGIPLYTQSNLIVR